MISEYLNLFSLAICINLFDNIAAAIVKSE